MNHFKRKQIGIMLTLCRYHKEMVIDVRVGDGNGDARSPALGDEEKHPGADDAEIGR